MGKPVKCFIVEGLDRDYRFINAMVTTFFKGKYDAVTICLPADQNIYMLYKKLLEDDFETDLIELLRENSEAVKEELEGIERQSIDEIYLFFDYDIHQDNLSDGQNPIDVLEQMLDFFDNETDHGKLYLSYPMVEALYDYRDGYCEPATACRFSLDSIDQYKSLTGTKSLHASKHLLRHEDWRMVLSVFGLRTQCLFERDRLDYSFYKNQVTAKTIFKLQKRFLEEDSTTFILSAFPEFLLDYFKADFWASHINRHRKKYEQCPKDGPQCGEGFE